MFFGFGSQFFIEIGEIYRGSAHGEEKKVGPKKGHIFFYPKKKGENRKKLHNFLLPLILMH